MKPKTMILTVVAVTCGLGASYMTSRLLAERTEEPKEKVQILIAKKALEQGLVVKNTDEVFAIKEVPVDMAEKDSLRAGDVEQLKGRLLKRALRPNDPIRQDDFLGADEYTIERLMNQGYRAIGIRLNQEQGASGFACRPLSRVDIISTVRRGSDKDSFSRVLLENVLVLAADTRMDRDGTGQAMPASVVTVALKQEDVVKVTLAREMGPLSLVLRKFGDSNKSNSDSKITVEDLMGGANKAGSADFVLEETDPPAPVKTVEQPKVAKADTKPVETAKTEPAKKSVAVPEPKVEPAGAFHTIRIYEGDKERRIDYRVDDNGQVISRPGDGAHSAPPPPRPRTQQTPTAPPRPEPTPPPTKDGN